MSRLIIVISCLVFSCGKGREESNPVFEFERKVGGGLSFDLPGIVSVREQSTPRESLAPILESGPLAGKFDEFIIESDLCPIDWSQLTQTVSSRQIVWRGHTKLECEDNYATSDQNTKIIVNRQQAIDLEISLICSEAIIDAENLDISLHPKEYIKQFLDCAGLELKSQFHVKDTTHKKMKSLTGHLYSEKISQEERRLSFDSENGQHCVFSNGEIVSSCIFKRNYQILSGNEVKFGSEKALKPYNETLLLVFATLKIKQNRFGSNSADISLNNWSGELEILTNGLREIYLESASLGTTQFRFFGRDHEQ